MSKVKILESRLRKRPATAENKNEILKRLKLILRKESSERLPEEVVYLEDHNDFKDEIEKRKKYHQLVKKRSFEVEDCQSIVIKQCKQLAEALRVSEHAMVYTGAGISTSANIPDYRGASGVWTNLSVGKEVNLEQSLTNATPTKTHMCLRGLVESGVIKHIVSQNCDGLHLRSGVHPLKLSEVHGNMYIEVCVRCDTQFYRDFDVTKDTALRRHNTVRVCPKCGATLKDTIVHFGERSQLKWPHNWEGAVDNVEKADLILCLGTSLKVLKAYRQLWLMDRPVPKRPPLYIVNLQWTPKDSSSVLKIHSRVDYVMGEVAKHLNLTIPTYNKELDLLFTLASSCQKNGIDVPNEKLISWQPSDGEGLESRTTNGKSCDNREGTTGNFMKDEITMQKASNNDSSDEKTLRNENSDLDTGSLQNGEEFNSSTKSEVVVPAWFGKGLRKKIIKKKIRHRKSL